MAEVRAAAGGEASRMIRALLAIILLGTSGAYAKDGLTRGEAAAGAREASAMLWGADLGNGHYQNPVLYADYSDPDVVAAGDDFYMTASSFNRVPGLPILHSKDLVNWSLIGHALKRLVPEDVFRVPQHGNGAWAPTIRFHDGKFWIFYPDPDFGIYMTQTDDPRKGEWSKPQLILPGKGIIDPSPLWDDDGRAWLVHAWARSRSGKNNILTLREMDRDGTRVADSGRVIIDGNQLPGYRTLEGPKLYKRNGYYYIFAPAGGVSVGWQSVFRSKSIEGPWENRVVLEQGDTLINGPHQGAWVHTHAGEDWFLHFQSALAYGRIVHLQPMQWVNDWPVIGDDADGDGVGNPVLSFRKPAVAGPNPGEAVRPFTPATSDEFDQSALGVQWQWNANDSRDWYSLSQREGFLRLFAQAAPAQHEHNLWLMPSLLLQKLPAPEFIAEVTLEIPEDTRGLSAGLILFGEDYAWIGVRSGDNRGDLLLGYASCHDARMGCDEDFVVEKALSPGRLQLRVTVAEGGAAVFSYRDDSGRIKAIGELFQARAGRWVGTGVGLFARKEGPREVASEQYVDVDSIRFSRPR